MCDFYNDSTACPSEAAEEDSEIAELKLNSCVKETSVTVRLADLLGIEAATPCNTSAGADTKYNSHFSINSSCTLNNKLD